MSGSSHECPECHRMFAWGADADSRVVDAAGPRWKSCRENAHWKMHFHMQTEHPSAGFLCPRRSESGMATASDGRDWWNNRDGHKSCSYCGSMSPDELFAAIEAGCELGPTDKSYKVYVDLPEPNPDQLRVVSMASEKSAGSGWTQVTEENLHLLAESGWGTENKIGQWFQMAPKGPTINAKFYFQHLSEDERKRFVVLFNAKKIKIGSPGHFYVFPFFMKRAPKIVA